ncbi:MAG TPA: hypothetical protein VJY41_01385 [Prolixibacteraceae bacterium]|nr:hypothetical protein [Prolixibacteraceae bacterium]
MKFIFPLALCPRWAHKGKHQTHAQNNTTCPELSGFANRTSRRTTNPESFREQKSCFLAEAPAKSDLVSPNIHRDIVILNRIIMYLKA